MRGRRPVSWLLTWIPQSSRLMVPSEPKQSIAPAEETPPRESAGIRDAPAAPACAVRAGVAPYGALGVSGTFDRRLITYAASIPIPTKIIQSIGYLYRGSESSTKYTGE